MQMMLILSFMFAHVSFMSLKEIYLVEQMIVMCINGESSSPHALIFYLSFPESESSTSGQLTFFKDQESGTYDTMCMEGKDC